MPFSQQYREQVSLLVRVLPFVADETCFALKGGTAINLFISDMPRLSVDIDLTYLPVESREESLRKNRRRPEAHRGKRGHRLSRRGDRRCQPERRRGRDEAVRAG